MVVVVISDDWFALRGFVASAVAAERGSGVKHSVGRLMEWGDMAVTITEELLLCSPPSNPDVPPPGASNPDEVAVTDGRVRRGESSSSIPPSPESFLTI